MSDHFAHALATRRRIEPRDVEFGMDLTYPLFIDGRVVAEHEVYAEFVMPADEPRSWGLRLLRFTDVDDVRRELTGAKLADAEQVLIKHRDAEITERAWQVAREAA